VAKAAGLTGIVLSTGGKSERYAQGQCPEMPEEAFVQMGDYIKFAIERAARMGFLNITVASFFGKAVKIGQGYTHTHASKGEIDFDTLSAWVFQVIEDPILAEAVARANTAREVFQMLRGDRLTVLLDEVGRRMLEALRAHAGSRPNVTAMIFDFEGPLVWKGSTKGDFEG
jgi:cobalt-precorrin-5B (C1)-methyltransferase